MKIYSDVLTTAELIDCGRCFDIDVQISEEFHGRKRRASFVLRPLAGMADELRTFGRDGRRVHACSWLGHYCVMAKMFDLDPDAKIVSALATWRGRADFRARAKDHNDAYGGGTLNAATAGA